MEKGGIVCSTGILGGVYVLNGFDPIKFIPNGVYLTEFHNNWPLQQVMDNIFAFIEKNKFSSYIGASYRFENIQEACMDLDGKKVNGKIVVIV